MDDMPSSEFRKRYATVAKPTYVTVNGHVIGKWIPVGSQHEVMSYPDGKGGWEPRVERDPSRYGPTTEFTQRPFTPVPKPKRK